MSTDRKKHGSDQPSGSSKKQTNAPRIQPDGQRDLGQALRSVYQKTVDEAIPAEMLDLLGKLG